MSDAGTTTETADPAADGARSLAALRFATVVTGFALAGTYLLDWVEIVEDIPGASSGETVAASEIVLFPEVIATLGLLAALVALVWWRRPAHLAVLLFGIVGTGISLYMRSFLDSGDTLLEVGPHEAEATAFEPALGMTVALVASALLIGTGFGAFLSSFETSSGFGPPTGDD